MSRPNVHVSQETFDALAFARACVLDQRAASHKRKDFTWDPRYAAATAAIDTITLAYKSAVKKAAKRAEAKTRQTTKTKARSR